MLEILSENQSAKILEIKGAFSRFGIFNIFLTVTISYAKG